MARVLREIFRTVPVRDLVTDTLAGGLLFLTAYLGFVFAGWLQ